jgi:hypothetical protein
MWHIINSRSVEFLSSILKFNDLTNVNFSNVNCHTAFQDPVVLVLFHTFASWLS